MKNRSILFILLALLAFSCVDPYEKDTTPAYEGLPIANMLAQDTTGTYTQWVKILKNTDLFNTMNLDDNYTCFVPSDTAVMAFLEKNSWSSVDEIPADEAAYLVKYHTIRGKVYEQSLFDNGALADTTATGDQLTIEIRGGGINAIYVNGEARIQALDIEATNGIVHVLDAVLTPVTETIWEKMEKTGFSIMKEAISSTGYASLLSSIFVDEVNPETGLTIQKKKNFTLFAVSDDVFSQAGISDLGSLASKLGATTTDYTQSGNKLNQFVAYHILNQQLDYDALSTFPEGSTSQNIQTLATNQLINVALGSNNIVINSDVSFLKYNINTKNGVIHEVNNLMEVKTPPRVKVEWELTDYSDLASLLSNYRKIGESTSVTYIQKGSLTSINWEAINSEDNNDAVGYLVRGKSDETYSQLVNYDAIVLRLGTFGWAEFSSPTIIAGTYNVSVVFLSRASTTQTGKVSASIDGQAIGSEFIINGLSNIKTEVRSTSLGQITFGETTTHKLKLLSSDNNSVVIDYIKLEPVN